MKLKTHSGTKKRVKVSGNKKLFFDRSNKRHLLINKSKRQKKLHPLGHPVHKSDDAKLRKLLPNI